MSVFVKTVRKIALAAVGVVSVTCITPRTDATITSGNVTSANGAFVKLTVPFTESNPDNTVGNDTFDTVDLYGFDEDQNIVLPNLLDVDDLADGIGGGSGPGQLAAGTTVASHYIFYDPTGGFIAGTVDFDSDILAVISSTQNLLDSDILINNNVTYLNPVARGLEGNDSVAITGLREITVGFNASTPGDYIRVLTAFSPGAATPEPVTATLGALGLGALAMATRRRRSA